MAKKNLDSQLDLFGGLFTPETTDTTPVVVEEKTAIKKNDFVFINDKIGVKIKVNSKPEIVEPLNKVSNNQENKATTKPKKYKPTTQPSKGKRGRKSYKEMDDEIGLIEIPEDEILNKKLYYPIRDVAGFFKVNTSLIRAWEIEFDILQPRKNRKGDRLFRVEDIKNLQIIYYLLRNKKFSIEGAKKYLKANKKKADVTHQLTQSLTKFRNFLLELKSNLKA